ncbi:MAG: CotH kinase family protein [Bacteroidia bacterium]
MKRNLLQLLFALIVPSLVSAQGLYNINTIQKIEVEFYQSNWDYILDTAKAGADGYIISKWVKINGVQFDSAGVKFKGNSSYNVNNAKNPFHIELDYVKNQDYKGYKDIKLSNGFKDPSFIREAVTYKIARQYMPAPDANFAQLYVNGVYIGVYTNCEAITKTFVDKYFYSKTNTFFFMDNFNCGLNYLGSDSSLYSVYTMKSDYGWNNLVKLCDTLSNFTNNIENTLDVDRSLWMLALDNTMVNLDSYIGGPKHNYYAYQDGNHRFNPIMWDVNESFGVFSNAGAGPPMTFSQMQTMTPELHGTDNNWPLISKLFTNASYKKMYYAHMKTILNENFSTGTYSTLALSYQSIVDTALQSDNNKFFTYSQFLSNVTTNIVSGPQTIPGITALMNTRTSYLLSSTSLSLTAPTISSPSCAASPSLNSACTITANIINTNSNGVYLGYRFNVQQKFNKIPMYDDGLHNDGAAGDNIYGASFTMTSNVAQYYVYAENNNAGVFSPVRAEYEFYTVVTIQTPQAGDISINEFLADNQNDVKNDINLYADWIELYNNSSSIVDLSGSFITDNFSNPNKFTFPANTTINPNSFLIIWADEGTTAPGSLHANFKLSAGGEELMLSNPFGTILDSLSFEQQNTNQSFARCPDGIGSYSIASIPTYSMSNCATSVSKNDIEGVLFYTYPNPASNSFFIAANTTQHVKLEIYNSIGILIKTETVEQVAEIKTSDWASGIYFIKNGTTTKKILILR